MNQKREEVTNFLKNELVPQVKQALEKYKDADVEAIKQQLENLEQKLNEMGVDKESSEKYVTLKNELYNSVDIEALENEVFSDLTNFFKRYYHEGDFLSLRRYKKDVYAIPYEGEEVKLHWANADQYYVKTSEYFRNYTFNLPSGKTVHFKLVEASTEQNNNKETDENERSFILHKNEPIKEDQGELIIQFEYRQPDKKQKQKQINQQTIEDLFSVEDYAEWLAELQTLSPTEKNKKRTVFEKYLNDYTARNTFDYFIHKDLGGFLRRELDFFIKNEVMHLDDLDTENEKNFEQYLSKLKVIKSIGNKIITFLEQIENFQKKLWLKKKFVVDTNYCLTLDRVPEILYKYILNNQEQIEEWKLLFHLEELDEFKEPLTEDFLRKHPNLVLDTRFFNLEFKNKLLSFFENLDEQIDGLLIQSENFQAINLLKERYKNSVKCCYIDPPYNKQNGSDFAYKDSYRHSSWFSMINDRITLFNDLLDKKGVVFTSLDENEALNYTKILEQTSIFNGVKLITAITNLKGNYDAEGFVATHEYIITSTKQGLSSLGELPIDEEKLNEEWFEDEYGLYKQGDGLRRTGADAPRNKRPKGWFPVFIKKENEEIYVTEDDTPLNRDDIVIWPINSRGEEMSWSWSKNKINNDKSNLLLKNDGESYSIYKKQRPQIGDIPTRKPKSFLYSPKYSSTNGSNAVKKLFDTSMSQFTPKSVDLIKDLIRLGSSEKDLIFDFFAGSGTTSQSVIELNREDINSERKQVLIEMGEYFNTVLLPRVKKVVYSKDWKNGKPVSREGSSHMFKYLRLESYEDTLNNISFNRSPEQQSALQQMSKKAREEYILSYMLDEESDESLSLLSIDAFKNPFDYKMNIFEGNESNLTKVDFVETFNYLIGLQVKTVDMISGIKVITGSLRNGEEVLILWRNTDEITNDKLETFFNKQGYNTKENEFDRIYVNGDNHLENLKATDDKWKVVLIEEEFKRLMFEVDDA